MRTRRPALALAAVFIVAPTLALAHGEQLFYMMFVVPPLVVPAIFVLAVLVWQAGAATKLRAGAAVAAASVATFGLNYGLSELAWFDSDVVFWAALLSQLVAPVAAWIAVARRWSRREAAPCEAS